MNNEHVQIKAEPDTESDIEQNIPRYLVQPDVPNIETIDLTNDEFTSEFENFLCNIPNHRKQSQKQFNRNKKPVTELITLQVAHVHLIDFYQDVQLATLFGIDFKNVMVYGRIIPKKVKEHNNTHIYQLDDGSGTVEVHFAHGLPKDLDNLIKVSNCEDILKTGTPLNEDKVPENPDHKAALKLLLGLVKTRCQRRLEGFKLGSRCFAIGRPFINWSDQVSIYAHSMYADEDKGGKSAEVFWKTHLATCYEREYSASLGCS
ncbi:uncharacterized protein LOC131436994 [Malaya genurostris]|uniref:uncharacterized protein LOC131436994 n=1 Tax=Malaya genurostris TaxID=325434 RepID=UPI0026F39CB6|nr:uncharacterized protein LOC131436994 [Malaya genurostris]